MKSKKIFLTSGAISTIAMPIVTTVACSNDLVSVDEIIKNAENVETLSKQTFAFTLNNDQLDLTNATNKQAWDSLQSVKNKATLAFNEIESKVSRFQPDSQYSKQIAHNMESELNSLSNILSEPNPSLNTILTKLDQVLDDFKTSYNNDLKIIKDDVKKIPIAIEFNLGPSQVQKLTFNAIKLITATTEYMFNLSIKAIDHSKGVLHQLFTDILTTLNDKSLSDADKTKQINAKNKELETTFANLSGFKDALIKEIDTLVYKIKEINNNDQDSMQYLDILTIGVKDPGLQKLSDELRAFDAFYIKYLQKIALTLQAP